MNFLYDGELTPSVLIGNMIEWLFSQLLNNPNRLAHGEGQTMTTGFSYPLSDMPNTFSLLNLYGCTSVIVISCKRMFMTHI